MRKILIIFLVLISPITFAITESLYVSFYFNMHSISDSITDKQCEELFKIPRQYTIVKDKVVYKDHPSYKILDYKRTNVSFLNNTQYLFTGVSTIKFTLNDKTHTARENVSFVLTIPNQQIQGSFIVDGYCKGNLIGVNSSANQWPPE